MVYLLQTCTKNNDYRNVLAISYKCGFRNGMMLNDIRD